MSRNVQNHRDTLLYLYRARPRIIKAVIKEADSSLINAISELAVNVLKGTVPLSSRQKAKLKAYKSQLRRLVEKRTSLLQKKTIVQKGGFLPALLGPLTKLLIPLASTVFGGILGR